MTSKPRRLGKLSKLLHAAALIFLVSPAFSAGGAGPPQAPVRKSDDLDRYLRRYERIRVSAGEIARRVRATGALRLSTRERVYDVQLEPFDVRSPLYTAEEVSPDGVSRWVPPAPVRTFKGQVPGMDRSDARFSITDDSFEGVILTPEEWFFVEPLRNFSPAADPSEMVFYRRSDIRMEAIGTCGTSMAHEIAEAREFVEPLVLAEGARISVAEIATEADYEYVTAKGGAAAANSAILDVINQVDGIYTMELSLSLQVIYQHAWATADDPFTSASASAMLGEFRTYWNSNFYNVPFDLAHMWTGKDMDGSTIGIAYSGVVCQARSYSYGISQNFNASPGKYILTAHEIGHNFGASHPDQASPPQTACSDTIMNSMIGTGFTFCPFSRSEISGHLAASASCLVTGPAAPSALTARAVSPTAIDLQWLDNSLDETGFKIERKSGPAGTWILAGTAGVNAVLFHDTGLSSNATYYYRVQAENDAGVSSYSNEASATPSAVSPPAITGVLPSSGPVGTVVAITGTNFAGTTAVRFNSTATPAFSVVTPTRIDAIVPAGAGSGRISVTTSAGTAVSYVDFLVTASRCDPNGDQFVNVLDIQLLVNAILGAGSGASIDINRDGSINVLDLQLLVNVVLGRSTCPP